MKHLTKYFFIFILIIFSVGSYFIYKKYNSESRLSKNSTLTLTAPTPTESLNNPDIITDPVVVNSTDGYKLPEGDQTYNISHGDNIKGPKATKIKYSPLSYKTGKTQTISVTFPSTEDVSSAVIFFNTDTKDNQKVTLKKTAASESAVWTGSWIPTDTIHLKYSTVLYFVGSSGTYSNNMNFL
jgi:hypothetical protein